ncbi:MAG TPA: TonB-dependent receptor, partial [Sphingomonas sp.]|nr:TonB-dependent receptor [Sphingomonas sp.]
MLLRPLLLASAALLAVPAQAEETPTNSNDAPATRSSTATETNAPVTSDQDHDQPGAQIVVTGTRARNTADVLGGTAVLAKEELTRDLRPTIGDTLANQPGVSATSFGPNASRPV